MDREIASSLFTVFLPMFIKSLEIQGFKSFPDRTRLSFDKDITAIVGPNGSGKSNISDALLWVMGEQRTKALRGGRMEDVIFGGTEKRSPMGYAQVSLTLDNSSGLFDVDSPDVTITRRYYRTGESEYMLNREPCRLRDITTLLMDTGLGRDGYSIIGQGKIADIVSARSTDRREIFEEAAGISLFRFRKEEAERKLQHTEENLLRINDKTEELSLQVGPLKKQSETAKRYLVLHDEQRDLEISVWMDALDRLASSREALETDARIEKENLLGAQQRLENFYAASEQFASQMREYDLKAEQIRETISALETQMADKDAETMVEKANIAHNNELVERVQREISERLASEAGMFFQRADELEARQGNSDALLQSAQKDYENACARLREAEKRKEEAFEEVSRLKNIIAGRRMIIERMRASLDENTEELQKAALSRHGAETRLSALEEMEREYEGMGKAVKNIMKGASSGTLRGIRGPISKLISVPDRYTLAIETALGGAIGNIVTATREDGKNAVEYLRRIDGGRATFDPMDALKPRTLKDDPSGEEGFIGIASDLVQCEECYRGIISSHIGLTVVVETLSDAVRISKKYGDRLRLVSLDGQLINAGGSITGGSSVRNAGILSRANEIQKLSAQMRSLREKEEKLSSAMEEAKRSLSAARYELETSENSLNEAMEALSRCEQNVSNGRLLRNAADERIDSLEGEASGLGEQAADARNKAKRAELAAEKVKAEETSSSHLGDRLRAVLRPDDGENERRTREIDELKEKITGSANRISSLEQEKQAIASDVKKMNDGLSEITSEKLSSEKRRTEADKAAQEENRAINELSASCSRLEQQLIAADREEKTLTDKLWDSYEMTRTAAAEKRIPLESVSGANRRIAEIKKDISRMGSINLGAIEEYDRVNERYEFLCGQKADVEKAKRELEKIISDLTDQMKEIFVSSFREVSIAFKQVFTELFQGGKADLQLEDENDVLSCGIEIRVQPPGKAVTSISLLSGGEKSFVAIALYYAIMKIRPTPFCVMDEVEAALDDANVDRSARYMRTLAGKTQFIVITHRRGTMEEADMLYGVTMQEKGVTTVLSVDLNEAATLTPKS